MFWAAHRLRLFCQAIFFISLGLRTKLDDTMLDALPMGLGLAAMANFTTLPLFMCRATSPPCKMIACKQLQCRGL